MIKKVIIDQVCFRTLFFSLNKVLLCKVVLYTVNSKIFVCIYLLKFFNFRVALFIMINCNNLLSRLITINYPDKSTRQFCDNNNN